MDRLFIVTHDTDTNTLDEIDPNYEMWTELQIYTNESDAIGTLKKFYDKVPGFKYCEFAICVYKLKSGVFVYESKISAQSVMNKLKQY